MSQFHLYFYFLQTILFFEYNINLSFPLFPRTKIRSERFREQIFSEIRFDIGCFSRRFYIIKEPDNYSHSFLVGAFRRKEPDYYSHSFVLGQTRR